jgi:uncharacterized protein (TIGR03435 family)
MQRFARRASLALSLSALVVGVCSSFAQSPEKTSTPRFEVASIKVAKPEPGAIGPGSVRLLPFYASGKLNVENMTARELILDAWGFMTDQVVGGPSWLDTERYDILAKSEITPVRPGEFSLMLQSLLADRFQLTFRRETKELPAYALVLARKDGKLGRGLTASKEGGCEQRDPSAYPQKGAPGVINCGEIRIQARAVRGVDVQLSRLAPLLSRLVGHRVVDGTGLPGNFDINMEWTPDAMQLPPDSPKPTTEVGPSIFTALQEQLGLKLESRKAPAEVLVIEHVERPSEN